MDLCDFVGAQLLPPQVDSFRRFAVGGPSVAQIARRVLADRFADGLEEGQICEAEDVAHRLVRVLGQRFVLDHHHPVRMLSGQQFVCVQVLVNVLAQVARIDAILRLAAPVGDSDARVDGAARIAHQEQDLQTGQLFVVQQVAGQSQSKAHNFRHQRRKLFTGCAQVTSFGANFGLHFETRAPQAMVGAEHPFGVVADGSQIFRIAVTVCNQNEIN